MEVKEENVAPAPDCFGGHARLILTFLCKACLIFFRSSRAFCFCGTVDWFRYANKEKGKKKNQEKNVPLGFTVLCILVIRVLLLRFIIINTMLLDHLNQILPACLPAHSKLHFFPLPVYVLSPHRGVLSSPQLLAGFTAASCSFVQGH